MTDIESLWDYNDPEASEQRFRDALANETDPATADEIKTQIARTYSLRRRFDEAHALLDKLEQTTAPRPRIHYLLEKGRTYNSSGRINEAYTHFSQAYDLGQEVGEEFLAADAAHMIAIASQGEDAIEWNLKTIELARKAADPRAKKWIASCLNNLGWSYHALNRYEEALGAFEEALEERRGGDWQNWMIARWCVARALRSLGSYEEALSQQRQMEAERDEAGKHSGFVYEEIAECLWALDRPEEARPYFKHAHKLLSEDEWIKADEPDRLRRLLDLSDPN